MSTNHHHVEINFHSARYIAGGVARLDKLIVGGVYAIEINAIDADFDETGPYFVEVDVINQRVCQLVRHATLAGWQSRTSDDLGNTWGLWTMKQQASTGGSGPVMF